MWTKLMVRVWALVHEKEYRKKAIKNTIIFLIAIALLILGFEVWAL